MRGDNAMTATRHDSPALATVVMYHFVQPADAGPIAGLKTLDVTTFRAQLAHIRRHYTPVSPLDIVRSLDGGDALPPNPIVLTFDDGYRSQYRFVLPLLVESAFPAAFFPVSCALIERQILDVNKIQCVIAAAGNVGRLVETIDRTIERSQGAGTLPPVAEFRAKWWKPSRWDPPDVVYVKRLLQHALPDPIRRPLVDALFRDFVTADEGSFAEELYMTVAEARELRSAGMTIGAHGSRHLRLPTLSRDDQAVEIDGALSVLDAVNAERRPFAYSYANGEHDDHSIELLRERGCGIAFTTRPEVARVVPGEMLTVPRLDANDLPTGN